MHSYGWIRSTTRPHRTLGVAAPDKLPGVCSLQSEFPPVYNQGQLGSCTSNAWAALFEYRQRVQGLPEWMPSRLFIYYNERAIEGTTGSDAGAQLIDGARCLESRGVPPETAWPYTKPFQVAPDASAVAAALGNKVLAFAQVSQSESAIKASVWSRHPMTLGISVYQSFETDAVAATGLVPMPDIANESLLGGHAVVVVGWRDDLQRFICRNSWGTNWGNAGYFTLPYEYVLSQSLAGDLFVIDDET